MGKTSYNPKWEEEYSWLDSVKSEFINFDSIQCLNLKVNSLFEIDLDKHAIVDKVRTQWAMYQLEDIPKEAYLLSEEALKKSKFLTT